MSFNSVFLFQFFSGYCFTGLVKVPLISVRVENCGYLPQNPENSLRTAKNLQALIVLDGDEATEVMRSTEHMASRAIINREFYGFCPSGGTG